MSCLPAEWLLSARRCLPVRPRRIRVLAAPSAIPDAALRRWHVVQAACLLLCSHGGELIQMFFDVFIVGATSYLTSAAPVQSELRKPEEAAPQRAVNDDENRLSGARPKPSLCKACCGRRDGPSAHMDGCLRRGTASTAAAADAGVERHPGKWSSRKPGSEWLPPSHRPRGAT